MENSYSTLEKRAFIKVLKDVMHADGYSAEAEKNFIAKIASAFSMTEVELRDAWNMEINDAIPILRRMPSVKKIQLGKSLELMATIDGRITPHEAALCASINIAVEIPNY